MFSREKVVERRAHKRFAVRRASFALDISRSGKVMNIGCGGLAFSYISKTDWLHSLYPYDPGVLLLDDEIYMDNIHFSVVSQTSKIYPFSRKYVIRLGLKFEKLSEIQEAKLKSFIVNNSCQEV